MSDKTPKRQNEGNGTNESAKKKKKTQKKATPIVGLSKGSI